MAPGGGPATGVGKEAKSYRHKLFVWSKKVVTGQSQNAKKRVLKPPRQMMKRTFMDMLPLLRK
jgi:hypothetical protein